MKIYGIYKITNKINEKVYIGSSCDMPYRWKSHIECLINNTHNNMFLQQDFNTYGLVNFKFEIEEFIYNNISKKKLLLLETEYILKYNSLDKKYGYNISLPTKNTTNKKTKLNNLFLSKAKEEDIVKMIKNMDIETLDFGKNQIDKAGLCKTNTFTHMWFISNTYENCDIVKKLITNYVRKVLNIKTNELYWTTYKDVKEKVKNKGYTKSFLSTDITPLEKRNILIYAMNPKINPFSADIMGETNKNNYSINSLLDWVYKVSDISKPIKVFIPCKQLFEEIIDIKNIVDKGGAYNGYK